MKLQNNKPLEMSCPNCGHDTKLIVKTRHKDGGQFIGCPNWPDCNYTANIPESVKMRAAGQKGLFD